jgi:hypothetical protein
MDVSDDASYYIKENKGSQIWHTQKIYIKKVEKKKEKY